MPPASGDPQTTRKKAITTRLAELGDRVKKSPTAQLIGEQLMRIAMPWKRRATSSYYAIFLFGTVGLVITTFIALGAGGMTALVAVGLWLAILLALIGLRIVSARKYKDVTGRDWKPPIQ